MPKATHQIRDLTEIWTQACQVKKPHSLLSPWHFPSPGPQPSPPRPILSGAQGGGLTMGCMAWGSGCILEDDGHQRLADGGFPAPGSLSPLPIGPPWGPTGRLAHEVGGIGSDNLEAVGVGAWWHEAEVLGRLHGEDFGERNFLAGHSTGEDTRQTGGLPFLRRPPRIQWQWGRAQCTWGGQERLSKWKLH